MSDRPRAPRSVQFQTKFAEPSDAPAIAAIWSGAIPGAWSEAAVGALIAGRAGAVWVTLAGAGARVGFLAARRLPGCLEVLAVAVEAPYRRAGLGAALLARALREARACDCRRVELEVAERNKAAISLYGRCHFVAVGRRPRYYPSGEDALLMTRELRDDR